MRRFGNCLILAGLAAAAVLLIASCDSARISGDGGYLGNTLDISSHLYGFVEKESPPEILDTDGILYLDCSGTKYEVSAVVNSGAFTVNAGIPSGAEDTALWKSLLPPVTPTPLFFSDPGAKGVVLNELEYNDGKDEYTGTVHCVKLDDDKIPVKAVWYVYSDKNVSIIGGGTYTGPYGTTIGDWDLTLKAGWNRIIMTISGNTGVFRVGNMPSGVYWFAGLR